jgi:molybdate transport system ATP-binding protein
MTTLAIRIELKRSDFRLAVDAELPLDGITVVFGASGSGKTSLLRVIAGLENNATGHLALGDAIWMQPGRHVAAHARRIGYVFQDGRLLPNLDVLGNLQFPLTLKASRIRLEEVVDALDLGDFLSRRVSTLSGGERQRVAIGRALLASGQILAMDEPLSSVDRARRQEILRYVKALPERFGLPILYVTHSLSELAWLADRVVVLQAGRILDHGRLREVAQRGSLAGHSAGEAAPAIVEATVSRHCAPVTELTLGSAGLTIPLVKAAPGATVRLLIDPSDVVIATTRPVQISIRNTLPVRIAGIESIADGRVELTLTIGDQRFRADITATAASELALKAGQDVYALVKSIALGATLRD